MNPGKNQFHEPRTGIFIINYYYCYYHYYYYYTLNHCVVIGEVAVTCLVVLIGLPPQAYPG